MCTKFENEIGILSLSQFEKLKNSNILLIGLGGVGGYVFESLVRIGINNFCLIDNDKFEFSNLNRQIGSLSSTIGEYKTVVLKKRALDINNDLNINTIEDKVTPDNFNTLFNDSYNFFNKINTNKIIYVIDCIDDVKAKLSIIEYCKCNNIYLLSCMGTANHIKSNNIKIDKIYKTKYCPLAKKIRSELNKETNYDFDALYIEEKPIEIKNAIYSNKNTSTISYIPAIAGLKITEHIVKVILEL